MRQLTKSGEMIKFILECEDSKVRYSVFGINENLLSCHLGLGMTHMQVMSGLVRSIMSGFETPQMTLTDEEKLDKLLPLLREDILKYRIKETTVL